MWFMISQDSSTLGEAHNRMFVWSVIICTAVFLAYLSFLFFVAAMKADRKRLKAEKLDLLSQMKQLYCTLEDKESELRDFIRNYEQRMRESDVAVKQVQRPSSTNLTENVAKPAGYCNCVETTAINVSTG